MAAPARLIDFAIASHPRVMVAVNPAHVVSIKPGDNFNGKPTTLIELVTGRFERVEGTAEDAYGRLV